MNYRRATVIAHKNRPPKREHADAIACAAADNVRISPNAKRLLRYYCSCGQHFAPALKMIQQNTGIASNKISTYRAELAAHNLLVYDSGYASIQIDWTKLKAFALMQKPLTKQESKTASYFPPPPAPYMKEMRISEIWKEERLQQEYVRPVRPSTDCKASAECEAMARFCAGLTPTEYQNFVKSFPEYDPAAQKPIIEPVEYEPLPF